MKLEQNAFALAWGICWGVWTLIMGLLAAWTGFGVNFVDAFGRFYWGYNATMWGSVVGGFWAFVMASIIGWVLAWLYNHLSWWRNQKVNN